MLCSMFRPQKQAQHASGQLTFLHQVYKLSENWHDIEKEFAKLIKHNYWVTTSLSSQQQGVD